jgi:hypothetical protein
MSGAARADYSGNLYFHVALVALVVWSDARGPESGLR